jgi:hypothetical protein
MAVHGRYAQVLVDQFNLSGVSNSLELQLALSTLDATNFESTDADSVVGPAQATLTHAGYFHGKTTGLEQALYNRRTTPANVAALFGTHVVACPAYVLQQSYANRLNVVAPANGLIAVDGVWPGGSAGGVKRGRRIFGGAIVATGAQAGVDFGAAGAAGGYAWLFVTGITGAAVNAVITVESDSDPGFGTAALEATFTFSAVGSQQVALTGVVGRYLRANLTSLGGSTGVTVTLIVSIDGVTYDIA